MKLIKILQVILLIPVILLTASAGNDKHVSFKAIPSKQIVKSGEEFTISLIMNVEKDWYTYSLKNQLNSEGIGPTQTEITPDSKLLQIITAKFKYPKPKIKYDEGFEMKVESYEGSVTFEVPVKALKDIDFSKAKNYFKVYMQLCGHGKCIPPEEYIVASSNSPVDDNSSVASMLKTGKVYKQGLEAGKDELVTKENSHINFKLDPSSLVIKSGEKFTLNLRMDIDKYWYTYSLKEQVSKEGIGPTKTEITIPEKSLFKLDGAIKSDEPHKKFDKGFEMQIEYFEGTANFTIPLVATGDIDFNKDETYLEIYLQLCDTARCLPPETYKAYVSNAIYQKISAASEDESLKTDSQKEIESKKKEGVFSFLWFAMSMGALALLTPCVFPMVPITVSFFTKRAEKTHSRGLRDSLIYALGIITTFTALGFILAAILGSTGIQDFATNPWINLIIATIFIVFALNLFGAFEIQIPTGLLNKLNVKSQGSGIVSVLLMGLTFSLTSFTCTVPFVGSSLVAAAGGEWFYPIIGMLGFSGVFAAPFFLLALFPSFMQKMPKAGGWMNNVKVVMGFLEIAAALKFISNADLVWSWGILPREAFLAIWIGCSILITLYILGTYKLPHDSPINGVSSLRIIFAIVFASVTIYLWYGLDGKPLGELDAFLPPTDYSQITGSVVETATPVAESTKPGANFDPTYSDWHKNLDEAMKIAKQENKILFIDFTGFTCTNCRWMETKMFPKPQVSELMSRMVKVKLFTDRPQEPYISNKKFQMEKFNSIELPLYVLMKPNAELIGTKAFTRDEGEFVSFLKSGLN